jgi:cysteine desulfurase/selenocysteine lyase
MSTATPHVDLRSLAPNSYVDGVYSIYNPQVGATRAGKPFLKCLLRDASGEVAARQWSFEESAFEATIGPATRLVAITGMSNVTGYVPPLDQVIERAHDHGARVLVDGAQYVSHHPVSVSDLECDFLAFSGHKMCGPTGIGALYARRELLDQMEPYQFGGDMIVEVGLYETKWARVPEKFEAGTPNIAGAIGMGEAARFLREIGMERIAAHERDLTEYARRRLDALDWIEQYGDPEYRDRSGICSFNLRGIHAHDVGSFLDQKGIAVRTGFHCAQPLMAHFGITGTVRASFYLYNTLEEIDRFVETLERVYAILN